MTRIVLILIAAALSAVFANPVSAYVGPGAGLSLLGALWGLLLAVGAALLFVILWPIRRAMKRNRMKKTMEPADDQTQTMMDENPDSPKR